MKQNESQKVKRDERVNVSIRFDTTADGFDLSELYKIEDSLKKLGVSFDTGFSMDGGRDWELDWSLIGPVSVYFRGKTVRVAGGKGE